MARTRGRGGLARGGRVRARALYDIACACGCFGVWARTGPVNMRPPEQVETERLSLRLPSLSDAAPIFNSYAQDAELRGMFRE